MPAPEQRVMNCPCGAKLLLPWIWSLDSAKCSARCPDSGAKHQVQATAPINVYRLDSKGNWQCVITIGNSADASQGFFGRAAQREFLGK